MENNPNEYNQANPADAEDGVWVGKEQYDQADKLLDEQWHREITGRLGKTALKEMEKSDSLGFLEDFANDSEQQENGLEKDFIAGIEEQEHVTQKLLTSDKQLRAAYDEMLDFRANNMRVACQSLNKQERFLDKLHFGQELFQAENTNLSDRNLAYQQQNILFSKAIKQTKARMEEVKNASPEAYYYANMVDLCTNVNDIKNRRIVATPYVKKQMDEVIANIKSGSPTLIHGHLGSGKTELAVTAAKKASIEIAARQESQKSIAEYKQRHPEASRAEIAEEQYRIYKTSRDTFERSLDSGDKATVERFTPLMLAGSEDTTSKDLFADKSLKLTKFNGKPLLEHKKDLDAMIDQWRSENAENLSSMDEKTRAKAEQDAANEILELYKLKNQAFGTEVETIKNAVYRGAEEGRPVIIDEMNVIPTAVLLSLNDVLNRRPGDIINIPGAEHPVKVKEGFAIIATSNLSSNQTDYGGTKELNPAFQSRFSRIINYDYLPQSTTDRSYKEQADPTKNELFKVMVEYLCEGTGDLAMPDIEKNLDKIFALAQLSRDVQDLFSGKWEESNVNGSQFGDTDPTLNHSVLSTRAIVEILKTWDKGIEMDLDTALWEGFIKNIPDPDDQNMILTRAVNFGFYQESDGWSVKPKRRGSAVCATLDEIRTNAYHYIPNDKIEIYSALEVADALYGPRPGRGDYPEDIWLKGVEIPNDTPFTAEEYNKIEEERQSLEQAISALEVLAEQCGCSNNAEPGNGTTE